MAFFSDNFNRQSSGRTARPSHEMSEPRKRDCKENAEACKNSDQRSRFIPTGNF